MTKIQQIKEETKFITSPASDKAKEEVSEYYAKFCLVAIALLLLGFVIFISLFQTQTNY